MTLESGGAFLHAATHIYGVRDTVMLMKTTIELNDELFRAAKRTAAAEGITLRELIESGLRSELESRQAADFSLDDQSVGGNGVRPGLTEGDWRTIQAMIYGDHGA